MKKILTLIIIILILSVSWYFWHNYYLKSNQKIISKELENLEITSNSWSENWNKVITKNKDEKIDILRKRFSLRWTIARWDSFLESNQLELAKKEYLKALLQNPNDEQIIKKLSKIYFDLKEFDKSKESYEKIINFLSLEEKQNYVLTLLYTLNYKSGNEVKQTSQKIRDLQLDKEMTFHYINAINCTIDFHWCKKNYDEFFTNNPEITFSDLANIKTAIENYKNFQSNNLYYKDALIIWAIFQDKIYTVSNILSENLLSGKSDYKPLILIIWKWYYELWDLENSKTSLEKYYFLEPNDVKITYILWNISFKLKDFEKSNIYYNSALKNWFEPKVELLRKLVYNYYLLWNKRLMLNIFWLLLKEETAQINDFSLWIYHAIIEWKTSSAILWSEKWLQKFRNKDWYEIFYWYLWWIKREAWDLEKASEYLKKWLLINPKNPLLTLNMWYLEKSLWKNSLALMYFKRTININWSWEFWELAIKEIQDLENIMKNWIKKQ